MTPAPRLARSRSGFSLLEVLLALSILTGAIAILGELTRLGSRNATGARDELTAQRLCETKLAEILCAGQMIEEVTDRPLETQRGWLYSVASLPQQQPGLTAIEVAMRQDRPPERRPIEFRLTRLVFRPVPPSQSETGSERLPDSSNPMPMPMPPASVP